MAILRRTNGPTRFGDRTDRDGPIGALRAEQAKRFKEQDAARIPGKEDGWWRRLKEAIRRVFRWQGI
jgi:hypothetical protein